MPSHDKHKAAISALVPPEVLRELIKEQKGYDPAALAKDQDTLVAELFRVCKGDAIHHLYEDYCLLMDTAIRCETVTTRIEASKTLDLIEAKLKKPSRESSHAQVLTDDPLLYDYARGDNFALFRYAAKDGRIMLWVSTDQTEEQRFVNRYEVVLHFSKAPLLFVSGAAAAEKAQRVYSQFRLDCHAFLSLNSVPLAQPRGKARLFYLSLKKILAAKLIKTKRDDLRGNYKTITLEARHKKPDLEEVSDFKAHYKNADSHYDVLQFEHANSLGIMETTHVKFGRPHGLFTFRPATSLTTIHYCFEKIADALSNI